MKEGKGMDAFNNKLCVIELNDVRKVMKLYVLIACLPVRGGDSLTP